jgi:hypothetical protein
MSQPDDVQKQIDAEKKKKELLDAQKATRDAKTALDGAQNSAAVGRAIGDVKAGPYTGTVTAKDKAGTIEAFLLSALAVKEAASGIATAVRSVLDSERPDGVRNLYVFGAKEFPAFRRLADFQLRVQLLRQAFQTASVKQKRAGAVPGVKRFVPSLATISVGLDAFGKILGFLKTDFETGAIDAKLDESLLLYAVAGKLRAKKIKVHLPLIYAPAAKSGTPTPAPDSLTAELEDLWEKRTTAAADAKKLEAAEGAEQQDPERLAVCRGAVALYDEFAAWLSKADATSGETPLGAVAQEIALRSALADGYGLLVHLEASDGGYELKKNLLAGLTGMPMYHMGGAAVSYLLFSGADGTVLDSNVIPIYGGFVKSDELRSFLRREF